MEGGACEPVRSGEDREGETNNLQSWPHFVCYSACPQLRGSRTIRSLSKRRSRSKSGSNARAHGSGRGERLRLRRTSRRGRSESDRRMLPRAPAQAHRHYTGAQPLARSLSPRSLSPRSLVSLARSLPHPLTHSLTRPLPCTDSHAWAHAHTLHAHRQTNRHRSDRRYPFPRRWLTSGRPLRNSSATQAKREENLQARIQGKKDKRLGIKKNKVRFMHCGFRASICAHHRSRGVRFRRYMSTDAVQSKKPSKANTKKRPGFEGKKKTFINA